MRVRGEREAVREAIKGGSKIEGEVIRRAGISERDS
jgi:hypothetical protein